MDDELEKIISPLPKGVNLDALLDGCHLGTGTREAFALEKLPLEQSFKPRYLPPPGDIQSRMDDDLEVRRILAV